MAVVGAENDNQLSAKTGVAQTTISTWRKRGKVPYEMCADVSQKYNISVDYLLFGSIPSTPLQYVEIAPIVPDLFIICWGRAERIVRLRKSLDTREVCVLLYNHIVESALKSKKGKEITIEQLVFAEELMEEIHDADYYASIGKVIEDRLRALPDGFFGDLIRQK